MSCRISYVGTRPNHDVHIFAIDRCMRASKFAFEGFQFLRISWKDFSDFFFGRSICWPRGMEAFDSFFGVLEPRFQNSIMNVFRLIKADTILRLDDTQIGILENGTLLSSDINKLCDKYLSS